MEALGDRSEQERAVPLDVGVRWDPNADDAVLIHRDSQATLLLRPNADDPSDDWLALRWDDCYGSVLTGPNDEARSGHRLWAHGLSECLWSAEVLESRWIADLEHANSVHPRHQPERYARLRHVILLLKETTFECVATGWRVERVSQPPDQFGA